jgi:SP family general alpha glucoside:H+ symporter-like MFS transporter
MVLIFFAPESPWWLVRKGRREEALRSIQRLGRRGGTQAAAEDTLAMMERTAEIEAHAGGQPKFLDLFKGVDLRRTLITCLIYASQNFAGNLIANQATFFFERKYFANEFGIQIVDFLQRLECPPNFLSNST